MPSKSMPDSRADEIALRRGGLRHIGDVLGELLECYQLDRAPFDDRPPAVRTVVATPNPVRSIMEDEPCSFCPAEMASVW